MRASEFILETFGLLSEVSMRPSQLRQMAAQTGALAGIEFEMAVPGVRTGGGEDDEDGGFDFSADERVTSFDQIAEFFSGDGINTEEDVERLVNSLKAEYELWSLDCTEEEWQHDGRGFYDEWASEWFDEEAAIDESQEEIKKEYGDALPKDEFTDMVFALVNEKKQEWLDRGWDEQNDYYNDARDAWLEEFDAPSEREFFKKHDYFYMSELPFDDYVMWPYLSGDDVGDIEAEFQEVVGRPVTYSSEYHGAERKENTYVIEPDSSIMAKGDSGGLEFVSPPLPVAEMLSDFSKVVKWAKTKGCYTNKSTGLHMNVSVPNCSKENLDYVKLALLLGDNYVLQQFGRTMNDYAASSIDQIVSTIKNNPVKSQTLLDQMRTGLSQSASKIIHSGATGKYVSINTHNGYVEFRSPGGDWLNEDWSKLENTLLRFVVALDAACDPQKYRQDYLKKLYQVLQPKTDNDPLSLFAKYQAGVISKSQLIEQIKELQNQRANSSEFPGMKFNDKEFIKEFFHEARRTVQTLIFQFPPTPQNPTLKNWWANEFTKLLTSTAPALTKQLKTKLAANPELFSGPRTFVRNVGTELIDTIYRSSQLHQNLTEIDPNFSNMVDSKIGWEIAHSLWDAYTSATI